MFWCLECDQAVPEESAIESNEYTLHDEVDSRQYEKESNYYCPVCGKELWKNADLCSCGKWKQSDKDWCKSCLSTRDKHMMSAMARIRIDTKLELNTEEVKNLILSWLEE